MTNLSLNNNDIFNDKRSCNVLQLLVNNVFCLCKFTYACHMGLLCFVCICICLCFSLKINKLPHKKSISNQQTLKLNILHHTGIAAKNLNTSITSGYYYKYQNDIHLARGCSIYNTVLVDVVFVCELDFYFTTMASVDDAKTEAEKRVIVIAMDGSVHAKYALTCKYGM